MKTLLLAALFTTSVAQAAQFVVEAKHKLSASEISAFKAAKIEAFSPVSKSEYFSRLYVVTGNVSKLELQKLKWAALVEDTFELTKLSIEPVDSPDRFVADELFPYQWSLHNQGQTYVREKDDIHNIPLNGVAGQDIKWKNVFNKLPSKRTIVAVLDSGLDVNHPDIQGNIWKNTVECDQPVVMGTDGEPLPPKDMDGNGFAGDCHGVNTADENANITDKDGHGSHVAGIIAAAKNDFGIVGVNPNALIMPIKVMRDSDSTSKVSPSVAFAKGIEYAVVMGADIINLSLGWPRYLATNYLKRSVEEAISRGVILVAAAGNNNSSEPLFPCATDGVICVGASTLDGTFAGFSNYGGHVDAVTPGEGILSLNPTIYESDFFAVRGYDIKSGTSQATPNLVGMLSILKAQKPDLNLTEALARIYSAKAKEDKKKYILGGEITWDSLSQEISGPVVRPVLKSVTQFERGIVLAGESQQSTLVFPVKNFGLDSAPVEIVVESLSEGVEVSGTHTTKALASGRGEIARFPVTISDMTAESNIKLKITLKGSEGELSFFHEIPVIRDIVTSQKTKVIRFKTIKAKGLGSVVDEKLVSKTFTVEAYKASDKHEFFSHETTRSEDGTGVYKLFLFRPQGANYQEFENHIVVDNLNVAKGFIRVDLNMDGVEDYLLQTQRIDIKDGKKFGYYEYFFLNSDLKPLWPSFPSARVIQDSKINFANASVDFFMVMNHPDLGKIRVPAFMNEGGIPNADQKPDFLNRYDNSIETRLFYLEPQVKEQRLYLHTLNDNTWKENVKKQLSSKWNETVMVENLLPVSDSDIQNGVLRALVSVGNGTQRKILISTFDAKSSVLGKSLPQIVLQTDGLRPLMSVGENGLTTVGESYMNIYDRSRAKIVTTKNAEQVAQMNYTHISLTDVIIGQIASFETADKSLSVLHSRDELVSLTTVNGKTVKTTRPKLRFSFVNSAVLSEMYIPVVYERNGTKAPALYVDSTAITANRVNLFEEQDGKLVASIQNSIKVPNNCTPMNPRVSKKGGSEFVLLCIGGSNANPEYLIRSYEMN